MNATRTGSLRGGSIFGICLSLSLFCSNVFAGARESDIPSGIALTTVRNAKRPDPVVAFATPEGRPLYTFADDKPGKSSCTGKCAATWLAVPAPKEAKAGTYWTIVARADGIRQWAFRGMPLYSYAKETDEKPKAVGEGRYASVPALAAGDEVDGKWHLADLTPSKWLPVPADLDIAESVMASGEILYSSAGRPVYAFSGSKAREAALPSSFRPVEAGQLERPVGQFSPKVRQDGSRQWVFRNSDLYTYDGDLEADDLNGTGLVPGMSPAIVFHYFDPDGVVIEKDEKRGGRLVRADTGQVLYARDRHHYAPASYNIRGLDRGNPVVGRIVGLSCDAQCEKLWQPLLAPADALPNSYWTVLQRPDGKKQWAYRGYALYSNAKDSSGEAFGEETWVLTVSQGPDSNTSGAYGLGLFWRVAVP